MARPTGAVSIRNLHTARFGETVVIDHPFLFQNETADDRHTHQLSESERDRILNNPSRNSIAGDAPFDPLPGDYSDSWESHGSQILKQLEEREANLRRRGYDETVIVSEMAKYRRNVTESIAGARSHLISMTAEQAEALLMSLLDWKASSVAAQRAKAAAESLPEPIDLDALSAEAVAAPAPNTNPAGKLPAPPWEGELFANNPTPATSI